MVVDVGGGTADIAVVSFNGIVKSCSLKMAGNKFDAAIIRGVTMKYKILIGEKTAEQAKKEIANVYNPTGDVKITVSSGSTVLCCRRSDRVRCKGSCEGVRLYR